jgi:hypothetical protein
MAHQHNVKSLISLMLLTIACVSAGAREANFDKTLQVKAAGRFNHLGDSRENLVPLWVQ